MIKINKKIGTVSIGFSLLISLIGGTSLYALSQSLPGEKSVLGVFAPSPSPKPTPTSTPSPSPTPTPTPTPSPTPSPTKNPTPTPTQTLAPIPLSSAQLEEWFSSYAAHYSIDQSLLKKIAYCESKFRPHAINDPYGGMFQFHEHTWTTTRKRMNQDANPSLRFNPEEAIKTAAFKIANEGYLAWPNCSR